MHHATQFRKLLFTILCIVGFGLSANVQAASVSYFLDQSNALPDGSNYLKVTIADGADGDINFTVEILTALSSLASSNFGIQKFGFNTSIPLSSIDVTNNITGLPTGWTANVVPPVNQFDGFGQFEISAEATGGFRSDPLTFSIIGVAGDTINDYSVLSTGTAGQGNVYYAAHVAGFCYGAGCATTSAYFGGSAAVPVPAAVWLFGSGLLGLIGFSRRK